MKAFFLILVAAGLLLTGCGKNNSSPHPQGTNASPTTNTATAPMAVGGLSGGVDAGGQIRGQDD